MQESVVSNQSLNFREYLPLEITVDFEENPAENLSIDDWIKSFNLIVTDEFPGKSSNALEKTENLHRSIEVRISEEFVCYHRGSVVEKVEGKGVITVSNDSTNASSHDRFDSNEACLDVMDSNNVLPSDFQSKSVRMSHSIVNSTKKIFINMSEIHGADGELLKYSIPATICPDVLRARNVIVPGKAVHTAVIQILFNPKLTGDPVLFKDMIVLVSLAETSIPVATVTAHKKGSYSESKKLLMWSFHNVSSSLGKVEVTADIIFSLSHLDKQAIPSSLPISIRCQVDDKPLSNLQASFEIRSDACQIQSKVKFRSSYDYRFL